MREFDMPWGDAVGRRGYLGLDGRYVVDDRQEPDTMHGKQELVTVEYRTRAIGSTMVVY